MPRGEEELRKRLENNKVKIKSKDSLVNLVKTRWILVRTKIRGVSTSTSKILTKKGLSLQKMKKRKICQKTGATKDGWSSFCNLKRGGC